MVRVLEREESERADELVETRAVIRSSRVEAAGVAGRIDGRRRRADEVELRLRVGERGADDRRAGQRLQRELDRVPVLEGVLRKFAPEGGCVVGVERFQDLVVLDAVVGAEEPRAALPEEAAEVESELLANVLRVGVVEKP